MKDLYNRNISYLRISVTELCNLRCQYCMPAEGIVKKTHEEIMRAEEFLMAASAAAELGITKLRITGGEPLVKRGIVKLCEAMAQIPKIEELCLTTNGVLLPKFAQELKEAGVCGINISLDTLDPKKYSRITRLGKLEEALAGIEAAEKAGFEKVKINCVLMGGFNDDEIPDFVNLTQNRSLEVRFIELMPVGDELNFDKAAFIRGDTVLERMPQLKPEKKSDGVATLYTLPGAKGRVGLIQAVSRGFCHACNKIRLTADGKIKPCLHTAEEISLKGLNQSEMQQALKKAIANKPKKWEKTHVNISSKAGRNMNRIGG